jgi:hypothetical protein
VQSSQSVTVSLLLLGAGLTACGEQVPREAVDASTRTKVAATAQLAQTNASVREGVGVPVVGCSTHNVIGELDSRSGDCSLPGAPATPNWARHQMFGDSTPDLVAWTEAVPGELQRYCSFEYIGSEPIVTRHYDELFAAIDAYSGMSLDAVALDCHSEVVQGKGLEDPAVTAQFADAFHRAVQWVPAATLRSTADQRESIEVAVLDTVAQSGVEPANEHGLVMGEIISEIACPEGDSNCASTIRHHMAMPRNATKPADWARGGDFGTMGDLATAIVAAVGHWRMAQLDDASAPKRLVINASLGWVPDGESGTASERALEQALEFAACNGALVIAAAGNVEDPACVADDSGPLAPARYQAVAAPDAAECARLGYAPLESSALPVFGSARPLVYAAGGLDGRDRPIVNGRPESLPPLAAYADHVSVESLGGYTTPLTGTSVSAAVVSATASLLWSYAPELTAEQVIGLIYDSGVDTGLQADFGFLGAQSSVHRVSVCAAMSQLCATQGAGACPVLDCVDPKVPQDGYMSGFVAALNAAVADPSNRVQTFVGPTGEAPVCERKGWDEQVEPQPNHPMCPDCGLDSPDPPKMPDDDSILSMSLDSQYRGTVTGIKVTTFDVTGNPTGYTLDQSTVDSVNDPNIAVTQVALPTGIVASAVLVFNLNNGRSSVGPITVY